MHANKYRPISNKLPNFATICSSPWEETGVCVDAARIVDNHDVIVGNININV